MMLLGLSFINAKDSDKSEKKEDSSKSEDSDKKDDPKNDEKKEEHKKQSKIEDGIAGILGKVGSLINNKD